MTPLVVSTKKLIPVKLQTVKTNKGNQGQVYSARSNITNVTVAAAHRKMLVKTALVLHKAVELVLMTMNK